MINQYFLISASQLPTTSPPIIQSRKKLKDTKEAPKIELPIELVRQITLVRNKHRKGPTERWTNFPIKQKSMNDSSNVSTSR